MPRHLIPNHNASHGGRNHQIDAISNGRADGIGKRRAKPFGAPGVHENPRALQVARAPQAGRKNEMPLQQGTG